jgi:hypothetical protein
MHHAAIPRSHQGCRGASSLPHRGGVCRTKVPIEVAAPLPATPDGDAAVLTQATTLKFSPQIPIARLAADTHGADGVR